MTTNTYNPFNKEISDLQVDDLDILKSVHEGWYVEYKQQGIGPKATAKSISAFANHYGGWLFFGIKQKDDGSNTAGSFPGLNPDDVASVVEDLRNGVKDCLSPSPFYEYVVIHGPRREINLSDGKSIIVVNIPPGFDTPYIHISGRIFRRVGDSSNPTFETDRLILDQLFQRRKQTDKDILAFTQKKLMTGDQSNSQAYMNIFFMPDPLKIRRNNIDLSFDDFVLFMSNRVGTSFDYQFDNFFMMANGGMIARDITVNDPIGLRHTWRVYKNGWSIITLPFSSFDVSGFETIRSIYKYDYINEFIKIIYSNSKLQYLIIDANHLFIFLIGSLSRFRKLMKLSNISGPLYCKIILNNIEQKIPYLDTRTYIDYINEYGYPIIQSKEETFPEGDGMDGLLFLPDKRKKDVVKVENEFLDALELITNAGFCLGFPRKIMYAYDENWLHASLKALISTNKEIKQ